MSNTHSEYESPFSTITPWIKKLIYLSVLFSILSVAFYAWTFKDNKLGDPVDFAHFGGYFGGLITPFLSLITIGLLIWSIDIQVKELKKSSSALEQSEVSHRNQVEVQQKILEQNKKANDDQLDIRMRQLLIQQIASSLDFHNKNYEALFNKKVLSVLCDSPTLSPQFERISIEDAFFSEQHKGKHQVEVFKKKVPEYMLVDTKEADLVVITLHLIREEIEYIVVETQELMPVMNSISVRRSHTNKTISKLNLLFSIGILDQSSYNNLSKRINHKFQMS